MSASVPPFVSAVDCASPEGQEPRSPRPPKGSALHPWELAASHFPGPPRPPFHMASQCSGRGLSPGGVWLVRSLAGELSVSPKCAPSPRGVSMGLQTLETQQRVKQDICEGQALRPAHGSGEVVVMVTPRPGAWQP